MRIIVAVLLLLMSGFLLADVSYEPPKNNKEPLIVIRGIIGKSDLQAFSNYVDIATREKKISALFVDLDSSGGDVETAIAIGYKLRQIEGAESFVAVRKGAKCASACVFLLAAGSRRWVEGQVGIHRPSRRYDDEATAKGQKAVYRKIEKEIKIFLDAMNI